eukprot:1193385-Prorocentrum_minimum.AAC.1
MRWFSKVLTVNSTVSVKNWRENWLNKVLTVDSTVSVKNWWENWLNKVLSVNSTVSVLCPTVFTECAPETNESSVKPLRISGFTTGETNSPHNYLRTSHVRVEP